MMVNRLTSHSLSMKLTNKIPSELKERSETSRQQQANSGSFPGGCAAAQLELNKVAS
jgi:hypothetical protein